jgi:PAS domain S-box-containing protein
MNEMISSKTKTREELIKELEELKQENKTLREKIQLTYKTGNNTASKEEEKCRLFIELAADAFFHGNKKGDFLDVNNSAVELTGYSKEELLKMNLKDLFSPDILNRKPLRYDRLKEGEMIKKEREIITKSGATVYVEMNSKVMPDGTFQSIFRDVTERRIAEEAIMGNEFRLVRAERVAKIGNWTLMLNTKTMIGSIGAGFIYGIDAEKLTLEEVQKIPLIEYRTMLDNAINDLVTKGKPYDLEFKIKRADDGAIIDIHSIADFDKENNIVYGVIQDITEQKRIEDALKIAKDQAEESDRLKSAFLANMSHEIRTPMNGILGFAELLKEASLTGEQQQEYIRIIEKSGNRMLNIINDIVDISKIEAGLMDVDMIETNINEQFEFLYNFFKPEVEAKGMQLTFKNNLTDTESLIKTDREKLYAILTNLLKNAVKYSKKGIIEFGCSKSGRYLEFYVKDTGIGISPDRKEDIFKRFIQADVSDKMAHQGAGLGLSISKAYVKLLYGKIWVESEIEKGSVFYFKIPYFGSDEEIKFTEKFYPDNGEEDHIKNLKILIAEDDEISTMLIIKTVKKYCRDLLKVNTGVEAIEACLSNPDIDLVLMDIKMPDMDGYEATRQIRQFNRDVIIIAQSAFGLSGDKDRALMAGCNAYVSKPIIKKEILGIIQKYFSK